MRFSGFIAAAAALTLGLATLSAEAASDRHHRGRAAQGSSSDTSADQLNAMSLQRAQAGQNAMTGSSTSGGMGGDSAWGGSSTGGGSFSGGNMGTTSDTNRMGGTGTSTGTGRPMR